MYLPPIESTPSPETTDSGTEYVRRDLTFPVGARQSYVYVPNKTKSWTHTSLLYLIHGVTGTRAFAEESLGLPHLHGALDRGWIVASASTGNIWGSPLAMSDFRNLYEYTSRRWWIDHTFAFGHSMGGMEAMVVGGRREIPDLSGIISLNGMIDTQAYRDNSTLSAFNATSWEDLLVKQKGHDPARDSASQWSGLPILFITTTKDTSQGQAQDFIDRATTSELITHLTDSTHTHVQNPYVLETESWISSQAPEYGEGQTVGTQPVPKWPGWNSESSQRTGVFSTVGKSVMLYRTDGTAVRLSNDT